MLRPYRHLKLALDSTDRQTIRRILKKGMVTGQVMNRLLILMLLDKGFPAKRVADMLGVSPTTVRTVGWRYLEKGLDDLLIPHREAENE